MNYLTKIKTSTRLLMADLLIIMVYGEIHTAFSLQVTILVLALGVTVTIVGFLFALSALRDIDENPNKD